MTVYIDCQSRKHYCPDRNVRSFVADVRSGLYQPGDVVIVSALFMNATIERASSIRAHSVEKTQEALARFMQSMKKTGVTVYVPVFNGKTHEVCRIAAQDSAILATQSFTGGVYVKAADAQLPFDLIFKTAAVGEDYEPPALATYVTVEGVGFDPDGRVFAGQCKEVRKGRTRSTFLAPEKVIDLEAGGAALLSEHHIRFAAMRIALRHYLARCGFRSVTIGLSGGLDSAIVAAVAVSVLGAEQVNVWALPSCYTSQESFKDARDLCVNLGLGLRTIEIMPAFELLEKTVNAQLPFGIDTGLMRENLQARIRGLYLMALSNADGSLVLNTGNKSELAVGYCTLYGDMVGGLAPLSDVYKTDLYAMCEAVDYLRAMIPVNILRKAPTAELRENQKDEDSLPPYEVLDSILRQAIEEETPGDKLRKRWGSALAQRVVGLVKRAQFKHRLAPLGVRLSRHPLSTLGGDYFEGLTVDR